MVQNILTVENKNMDGGLLTSLLKQIDKNLTIDNKIIEIDLKMFETILDDLSKNVDTMIVDLRSTKQFGLASVIGSSNVPLFAKAEDGVTTIVNNAFASLLLYAIKEVEEDLSKIKKLILICNSGNRSGNTVKATKTDKANSPLNNELPMFRNELGWDNPEVKELLELILLGEIALFSGDFDFDHIPTKYTTISPLAL